MRSAVRGYSLYSFGPFYCQALFLLARDAPLTLGQAQRYYRIAFLSEETPPVPCLARPGPPVGRPRRMFLCPDGAGFLHGAGGDTRLQLGPRRSRRPRRLHRLLALGRLGAAGAAPPARGRGRPLPCGPPVAVAAPARARAARAEQPRRDLRSLTAAPDPDADVVAGRLPAGR